MFAVLGDIEFELLVYWDGFDVTSGVDYAEHSRIEGKPGLQFIGEKLDELSISLVFNDLYCQPDVELARLQDAMVAHQAMALVFGNGDYRGWFVITDLRTTSQQTDGYGNVQALSAEISLREYIGDPKNPLTPPAVSGDDPNIDSWSDSADDSFSGSDMFEGLSNLTDGLGAVSDALDAAAQAFEEALSWVEDVVAQTQDAIDDVMGPLKDALDDVLSPLDDVKQALTAITDGSTLTDILDDIEKFTSQIAMDIDDALAALSEIAVDNFACQLSQALAMVRSSQALMEGGSTSISKLAAAIIIRSV